MASAAGLGDISHDDAVVVGPGRLHHQLLQQRPGGIGQLQQLLRRRQVENHLVDGQQPDRSRRWRAPHCRDPRRSPLHTREKELSLIWLAPPPWRSPPARRSARPASDRGAGRHGSPGRRPPGRRTGATRMYCGSEPPTIARLTLERITSDRRHAASPASACPACPEPPSALSAAKAAATR